MIIKADPPIDDSKVPAMEHAARIQLHAERLAQESERYSMGKEEHRQRLAGTYEPTPNPPLTEARLRAFERLGVSAESVAALDRRIRERAGSPAAADPEPPPTQGPGADAIFRESLLTHGLGEAAARARQLEAELARVGGERDQALRDLASLRERVAALGHWPT